MNVMYWLFAVIAGTTQVVGPFHGAIACEKAASQVRMAAHEAGVYRDNVGTACLSEKHANFKYKEPAK